MLSFTLTILLATGPGDTVVVTLDQAVTMGVRHSPAIAAARAARAAPAGDRAESVWPFPSPATVEFGRTRRANAVTTSFDRMWTVRQEFDVSGRGFLRAGAAGKRIKAAQSRTADAERLAALDARIGFTNLVLATRRAAMLDTAARFSERLADVARRRLAGGAINALETNAAVLEAARQRSTASRAAAERAAASFDLARVIGLATGPVSAEDQLPVLPAAALPDVEVLVALAISRRPDRAAASWEVSGASGEVAASRRALLPTAEFGVHWGAESGTDDLRGISVGLRVPVFRRGQAQRGQAIADQGIRAAELLAVERLIRAEVAAAAARFEQGRETSRRFAEEVLRAAAENVALSERAFEEGKIGIPDLVVLRSVAIGTRLEHTEVLREAYAAWFRLAAALAVEPADLDAFLGGLR